MILQKIRMRKAFFWIVVVVLPLLFPRLAIRLNALPNEQSLLNFQSFLTNDLDLVTTIGIRYKGKGFVFPDLIQATKIQVDTRIKEILLRNWSIELISLPSSDEPKDIEHDKCEYIVDLNISEEDYVFYDDAEPRVEAAFSLNAVHSNDLPFILTQGIIDHLIRAELDIRKSFEQHNERPKAVRDVVEITIVHSQNIGNINGSDFRRIIERELEPYRQSLLGLKNVNVHFCNYAELDRDWRHSIQSSLISCLTSNDYKTFSKNYVSPFNSGLVLIDFEGLSDSEILGTVMETIEEILGFPQHPKNNLKVRLAAMEVNSTLEVALKLLKGIINLRRSIKSTDKEYKKVINEALRFLYGFADIIHQNSSIQDWSYFKLNLLHHQKQIIELKSIISRDDLFLL